MRTDLLLGLTIVCCLTNTISCMQGVMYSLTYWTSYIRCYNKGYAAGSMDKENEITSMIGLMTSNEQRVSPFQKDLAKRIKLPEYGQECYGRGLESSTTEAQNSSFSIGSFCAGALCATLGLGAYYLFTKGSSSSLFFDSAKV